MAVGGCEKTPAVPVKPAATKWVEPLPVGAISYFNAQCKVCHGEYGTQIYEHPRAHDGWEAYRGVVEYMVKERAASALSTVEMDAQTTYCASIAAATEKDATEGSAVFVCVKKPVNDGGLEGEVTPGCTVMLIAAKGQVRVEAVVDKHTWSFTPQQVSNMKSSAGDDWVNAVIEARPKSGVGETQRLVLSEGAFKGPKLREP